MKDKKKSPDARPGELVVWWMDGKRVSGVALVVAVELDVDRRTRKQWSIVWLNKKGVFRTGVSAAWTTLREAGET